MQRFLSPSTLLKVLLPGAMIVGVAAGALAQEATPEATQEAGMPALPSPDYVVLAGASGPANADILEFAPHDVQVHQGDTITWTINGFHNVHFAEAPTPFIIPLEMEGQPPAQVNPAVAFPTVENGGSFTGGEANSGLPQSPTYTLTIDAEPGTYTYFCDIHPGMSGTVTVVPDDQEVPSAQQVELQAVMEVGGYVGQGIGQYFGALEQAMAPAGEGGAQVFAGLGVEVTNNLFLPYTTVIAPGDSVTWTMQADSRETHTITWPPFPPNSEFIPIEQEGGPPVLAIGPVLIPTVQSGDEIGADGSFNYVILPGETFSLTFTDPGVYPYICSLHPGMAGTIVVMPEA